MSQATRIKQCRKALNLTQQELADRVGVSRVAISHWENDPTVALSGKNLERLCKALETTSAWILHGREEKGAPGKVVPIKTTEGANMEPLRTHEARSGYNTTDYRLPILPVTASAGHGAVVFDEDPIAFMELPKQMLRDLGIEPTRHLRMISIRGDSMKGTLNHGDFAIIDTSIHAMADDGVYVLNLDGQLLIKRLQRLPGNKVRVISDNDNYPHYEINETHDARICGRFIGGWSFGRM